MKTDTKCENRSCLHAKNLRLFLVSVLLLLGVTAGSCSAQTYTILHTFTNRSSGYYPAGPLSLYGDVLFGAAFGGANDRGLIFKVNANGTEFTVLKEFTGDDGTSPYKHLAVSGSKLYGATIGGGNSNIGTVFVMNTDGTGHTVLKHFTGSDGRNPYGGVVLGGNTLYGTTQSGGTANKGTVFKLNTDGSGFTVLKHFYGYDGDSPIESLVLSGATLFGGTRFASSGGGTIFKINTDGSGFAVLKQLTNLGEYKGLALDGTNLYGTAYSGMSGSATGTVFRLSTEGADFTLLRTQIYNWPEWNMGGIRGPIVCDSTLYVTTTGVDPHEAHTNSFGTVFRMDDDGSDYHVLQRFDFTNGSSPDLSTMSGTTLYGVATYGGTTQELSLGNGVIFSLSLPPPAILPESQTVETGSSALLSVAESDFSTPLYQWFLNGTNAIAEMTTSSQLDLTNVQPDQIGAYTVVVTNAFGSITSRPAMLNVIPPVERRMVPGVVLNADTGSTLNLEYTDVLGAATAWLPLATTPLTSPSQFYFDLTTPLPPQRFYRAWQVGPPSVMLSLNLHMIPALTLTGDVSSKVRVDGINAIGSTSDWFTLDTVTLTNTAQLYFDVAAPGQPARLYRLTHNP